MNDLSGRIGFGEVGLSLLLVAVAVAISWRRRAGLQQDILVATFRSFAQLLAVGYVLEWLFKGGRGWLTPLVLGVMVLTATLTSASRGKGVPGARAVAAV